MGMRNNKGMAMMGKGFMALLLLGVSALAGAVETPADEQTRLAAEYSRVAGIEDMYSNSDRIFAMVDAQMRGMEASVTAQMSPEEKAGFRQAMVELEPDMRRIFTNVLNQMRPAMTAVIAQTYSAEELRALVAFYSTPTGRAVVSKNMVLAERMMEVSGAHLGGAMQELQAVVARKLDARKQPAKAPAKAPAKGK